MADIRKHNGAIISPIESLERYLKRGGTTIVKAAFEHSYFVHPDRVRKKTPFYPDRARLSRKYYPKLVRGDRATWKKREVRLGDNSRAQMAWARYSGRHLERASGYGVRHVWGHPWDPDAFTAGWNLCYMPFWAGMLTERQHPHPELEPAIRQAAWDLYFRHTPVCAPPDFVTNPGIDLDDILRGQPILILVGETARTKNRALPSGAFAEDIDARIREIREITHQSWSNLRKAVLSLQKKPHEPFGTPNVKANAKSSLRRIQHETKLDLPAIEHRLTEFPD